MLDPRFFQGRWKATAVAKTHTVVLHMTREGLELLLQQNPLAQVRGRGGRLLGLPVQRGAGGAGRRTQGVASGGSAPVFGKGWRHASGSPAC